MKKFTSLVLALIMAISCFTGCSGTKAPAQSPATAPSAAAPSAAAPASGTPAAATTIKVLHYMSEQTKKDGFNAIIADYAKKNPDVTITVETMAEAQYMSTLQTKIASGDAPDIIFGRPNSMAHLVEAGQIYDLTGQPVLKSMSESEISSVTVKGKPYGVALDAMVMGTFYNKDMFAAKGYTVPKTYEDFMKIVKGFEASGQIPFVRAFKDMNYPRIDFDSQFRQTVVQEDQQFYADIQSGKTKFSDYAFFKKALADFAARLDVKSDDDMGTDPTRAIQLFASGKYPMLITGSWIVGDLRKNNPDGNFGFFPIPYVNAAGECSAAVGIDDTFMISTQTKNFDACIKFFEYLKSAEASKTWYDNAKVFTPSVNDPNLDPLFQDMSALAKNYKVVSLDNYLYFSGEYRTRFTQYLQLFASTDNKDIDKFIADLEKEFASITK